MLYKDKLPCDPLLHFDSKDAGTIKWTWRTKPARSYLLENLQAKEKRHQDTIKSDTRATQESND